MAVDHNFAAESVAVVDRTAVVGVAADRTERVHPHRGRLHSYRLLLRLHGSVTIFLSRISPGSLPHGFH